MFHVTFNVFSSMDEGVTFLVGKGKKAEKFLVHKGFACNASPAFKAALSGSFSEAQTLTYDLSDTSSKVFRLLLKWLCNQDMGITSARKLNTCKKTSAQALDLQEKLDDEDMLLVQLWILAEYLFMPRLRSDHGTSTKEMAACPMVWPDGNSSRSHQEDKITRLQAKQ
ncbi:hypothetical protein BDZ45DRAFT_683954 [Acephala macrosclerotiorum]|nr:hypothetical protein BDZ45DRAFT_683954 [Acephala macrosclerotiorum]